MSSRQPINVVLLTDQKYANLTAIAIASLVTAFEKSGSRSDYALAVHVVCIEVDAAGKALMARAAHGDREGTEVSFASVDHVLPGNPQGKLRWVQLVSLKIHLPDILPNLDRVIFLDSDIVVVEDITPLWNSDLEGHWMGVVPCLLDDPRGLKNYDIFKIKFNHVAEPINAGIMLFDLARMRALGVTATLDAWQREHLGEMKLPEQEAISVNYPRQWKVLPHAWNFRPYGEPYWTAASWEEFRKYLRIKPAIVHFQGNVRPFDLKINLPYYEDWRRCYRRVNPDGVLDRKTLGYFQFVFFEYPDVMCKVSNLLPRGLLRFGLMIPLLGLVTLPHAIFGYVRYLRNPEGYVLRIYRYLAQDA